MGRGGLHHTRVTAEGAAPRAWLLFLHGIFGAGRNWASLARRLTERRRDWGGVLVDLRLHGRSQGLPPPHTLQACARDLEALARRLGSPTAAVVGHSFGGKVALAYAAGEPRGLDQLWVVDSTPAAGPPAGSAVEMLEALRALPDAFASRGEGVEALRSRGFPRLVADWMATNLVERNGSFTWRFDIAGMESLLEDFFRSDLWDVVETPPGGTVLHFVKAEGSDILGAAACRRLEEAGRRTGRVYLHRVPGGHWLNVENPDVLVELLEAGLPLPKASLRTGSPSPRTRNPGRRREGE